MTWPMFPKKPGAWRVSDSMKKFWCGRAWPVAVPSGFSAFSTKEHWVLQILSRLTASYPNSLISCGQLLIFRDWQWACKKKTKKIYVVLCWCDFPDLQWSKKNPWKLTTDHHLSTNWICGRKLRQYFDNSMFLCAECAEHWVLHILSRLTASYPNSLISCGHWAIVNFQGLGMSLREKRKKNNEKKKTDRNLWCFD